MNIGDFVLLGFATWRLTSLLYREEGPFGIFVKFREMLGIQHIDGEPCVYPDRFWCKLFSCVWCLSVWAAFGMAVLYIFLPQFAIYFALWLSLSTIVIMVDKWLVVDRE